MQKDDLQALRTAVKALEHPRLAARLAEIAGKPIELVSRALPETASGRLPRPRPSAQHGTNGGVSNNGKRAQGRLKLPAQGAGGNIGAVGGSFGFAGLPIELPISTVIMCGQLAISRALRARI